MVSACVRFAGFLVLLLSSCVLLADNRLEGIWTSDKEMTLENLADHSLSDEQLAFLEKNLGDMQYIHKDGKVAVSFVSAPIKPLQFSKYTVYESTADSIVVGHKTSEKVKLHFYKHCFFHMTDWGINEYFCKTQ